MNITRLELYARELQAQKDYYSNVLELPVNLIGFEAGGKSWRNGFGFHPG
jgi:hypothetical protein